MGNVTGIPVSPRMDPINSEHIAARKRPYYDCHLTAAELTQLCDVLDNDSVAWANPISVVIDTVAVLISKFKSHPGAVYACARTIGEGLVLTRRDNAQGKFKVCVVDFNDPEAARYDAANFIHGYVPLSVEYVYR